MSAQRPPPPVTTPSAGGTATVTLAPVADAYVDATTPTTNFGTAATVFSDTSPSRNGYFQFGVSGITGTVTNAKLRVYVNDATVNVPQLFAAANGWTETGVTWNNAPATIGPVLGDAAAVSIGTWLEFTVTSTVTGNGTYSYAFIPQSADGIGYASRTATANQPQLVLTISGRGGDTQAPSTPGSFTASATSPTQVQLSWTASTDNVGVTGYTITRNSVPLTTTAGSATSYLDTTATAATAYIYAITATDAAANVSAAATSPVTTPSSGTTIVVSAVADAYVDATTPTTNFGTAATVYSDNSPSRNGYFQFGVSGITGTVTNAKLRVYVNDATVNVPQLFAAANGWTETGVTWNNAPATVGAVLGDAAAVSIGTWLEFDGHLDRHRQRHLQLRVHPPIGRRHRVRLPHRHRQPTATGAHRRRLNDATPVRRRGPFAGAPPNIFPGAMTRTR